MKIKPVLVFFSSAILIGTAVLLFKHRQTEEGVAPLEKPDEVTAQAEKAGAKLSEAGIPAHLKTILENRRSFPPRLSRTNTFPADEIILLKAYQATTNLADRYSLTWALSQIGGDATVATFEHALTDEFARQTLRRGMTARDFDESDYMHGLVYALGFLAVRNDKAFTLLQKGVDPWFWHKNVRWQSDYGADNYGILAGRSIVGIGISGRAEASVLLEKLKDTRLTNDTDPGPYRRTLWDGLMDAAFYNWLIHAEGREAFERHFSSDSDVFDHDGRFRKWQASEDGKKWGAWAAKFRQKAQAEMEERERAQPK